MPRESLSISRRIRGAQVSQKKCHILVKLLKQSRPVATPYHYTETLNIPIHDTISTGNELGNQEIATLLLQDRTGNDVAHARLERHRERISTNSGVKTRQSYNQSNIITTTSSTPC
jgi:hypothetical protein